ncbi:MAG: MBL fold metallo-hydrolase [Bacteroidales bacterium]|nr:MBL fold metallo-hydrolase [Bacteroidales bacterium]
MELIFLGTGTSQGVPVITCTCSTCHSNDSRDKRLRTSAVLKYKNKTIVFDAGPDFRQQMLREKIVSLDAIILTHEHKDHVAGLDDIRPYNFRKNKAMNIYLEKNVEARLKKEFEYVFDEQPYPGAPQMNLINITENPFLIDDITVVPIRIMHKTLPILGFRIENMAYITDASFIEDKELEKLQNLDVLTVNALMPEKHYSHFSLEQALEVIDKVKPQRAYLTHISHSMGRYKEIENSLPDNIFFAFDGLKVTIS